MCVCVSFISACRSFSLMFQSITRLTHLFWFASFPIPSFLSLIFPLCQYMYNGILTIQNLVGDFILEDSGATTIKPSSRVATNGVRFVPFPTRQYEEGGFFSQIGSTLVVWRLDFEIIAKDIFPVILELIAHNRPY